MCVCVCVCVCVCLVTMDVHLDLGTSPRKNNRIATFAYKSDPPFSGVE